MRGTLDYLQYSAMPILKLVRGMSLAAAVALLAGCDAVVMSPSGDVAAQQRDLIVWATVLMLLVIVPVIILTLLFAWRYRSSNKEATYKPDWDHSTVLELVIWGVPLLIIIALGAMTYVSTHKLDPYRPLDRIAPGKPVPEDMEPLVVEVVSLDWKWLFFYPEQGIATVNELVVPQGRPLQFKITASSVMNSFFVPAMAGQIYAMPGMETRLHAVMNRTGEFTGFSANYSGAGFSNMRFATRSVTDADFAKWVSGVKAGSRNNAGALDRATYLKLEKPSEKVPVIHYASVSPDLYGAILDMCVDPGKMCMSEMMALDAQGGLGKAGIRNVEMLAYDKYGREASAKANANPDAAAKRELAWVRALCKQEPGQAPDTTVKAPANPRTLTGAGLSAPQSVAWNQGADPAAHSPLISRN